MIAGGQERRRSRSAAAGRPRGGPRRRRTSPASGGRIPRAADRRGERHAGVERPAPRPATATVSDALAGTRSASLPPRRRSSGLFFRRRGCATPHGDPSGRAQGPSERGRTTGRSASPVRREPPVSRASAAAVLSSSAFPGGPGGKDGRAPPQRVRVLGEAARRDQQGGNGRIKGEGVGAGAPHLAFLSVTAIGHGPPRRGRLGRRAAHAAAKRGKGPFSPAPRPRRH